MFSSIKLGIAAWTAIWLVGFPQYECSITMEQLQKTAKTFRQVCQPKHQITDAVADAVSNGVFTDTKQFKCYVSCLLEIMQVARRGKVNYEKSLRQIDTMLPDDLKSDFRTGLEACKNAAKDIKDHCEASYVLVQCFYKNNPKFIFP